MRFSDFIGNDQPRTHIKFKIQHLPYFQVGVARDPLAWGREAFLSRVIFLVKIAGQTVGANETEFNISRIIEGFHPDQAGRHVCFL